MQQNQVRSIVYTLQQNIRRVIVGKDEAIELALIALLCKGHVLIEDVPGVGKTTLVAALARSLSCSFKRIQFTPDVTPSDITGFTMPSLQTGEMEYKSGASKDYYGEMAERFNKSGLGIADGQRPKPSKKNTKCF